MHTRTSLLNAPTLNGWWLFGLIVVPICGAVMIAMTTVDLASPYGVSAMIQFSVRLAVPWLFLAFSASSLATLLPGNIGRWIRRNRRIIGLCFAAGMAWQLVFILWLVIGHWDYYTEEAYSLYDIAEQLPGYLILFAMTATSFPTFRAKLSPRQWQLLHTGGIYFLWAVVWSTYWFELYYYDDVQLIDYAYYWAGFLAWGLRVAAWIRIRPLAG